MSKTFDEAVHIAATEVADLVVRKQRDYGPKNIMNSITEPEIAIAIRLNDKLARLVNIKNRLMKGESVEFESLKDTADDIIGYGLVLKMVVEETFLLPLEKNSKNEA